MQHLEAVAERAYIYGLQQAIYYGQRWTYTQNDDKTNVNYAGLNQLAWVRKQITPDYPVVTPNATTLYGLGFLDLRSGPVVIEVPEITDRYFSVQVMDQYGIFRMIVGSPFNGTKARKYILVPPGFDGKIPADFPTTDILQWPSRTASIVARMANKTGSDAEIKGALIAKAFPTAKLDGKDEAYMAVRLGAALELLESGTQHVDALESQREQTNGNRNDSTKEDSIEAKLGSAYKTPKK